MNNELQTKNIGREGIKKHNISKNEVNLKPMIIKGMGIDIVKIERIDKALEKWERLFEKRVFTQKEREYASHLKKKVKIAYLAGRFAAKEAIFKSLGGRISWQDIEILSNENGQPYLTLSQKTKKILDKKRIKKVLVTISHNNDYAIAQAMAL